ncbi:MAG: PEGA domain-containing protein [Thermoanaerobaculia bacterium]
MTEQPDDEEPRSLPRWVPILIAAILVVMAGLAVYTGLRYRGGPLGTAFRDAASTVIPSDGGAPGEPLPGASRVVHDTVPRPGQPSDDDRSRVVIRGDPEGVIPSIRLSAGRAMNIVVEPADALIYVNGQPIGTARQFAGPDLYEFPAEGEYRIRLTAPGYDEIEYVVVVDDEAPTEVADIETKLKKSES